VAATARSIAQATHVRLAETLAERIAIALLADARVQRVRVSVEKPDVLPDVTSVGVVVERTRF
jgi:dihydroneopterin aldolase